MYDFQLLRGLFSHLAKPVKNLVLIVAGKYQTNSILLKKGLLNNIRGFFVN